MARKQRLVAQPDYDFTVKESSTKEVLGKSFFTSEESIIKCTQGNAKILINSSIHNFETGYNFFLADAMHFKVVECSDDFKMLSCLFSLQFFNEIYSTLDNKIIDVIWYSVPDLYSADELISTNLTIDKIILLSKNANCAYRHKIAVNLVLCYLYEIYDITHRKVISNVSNTANHIDMILDKFCLLCRDCHAQHRNIEFYAQSLNISIRHLHTITKKAFQSTPKAVLDYYTSGAAKRLLLTTTLTNLQIADKLNFPDQATFGQFFKRNVGIPPAEFRKKYK